MLCFVHCVVFSHSAHAFQAHVKHVPCQSPGLLGRVSQCSCLGCVHFLRIVVFLCTCLLVSFPKKKTTIWQIEVLAVGLGWGVMGASRCLGWKPLECAQSCTEGQARCVNYSRTVDPILINPSLLIGGVNLGSQTTFGGASHPC